MPKSVRVVVAVVGLSLLGLHVEPVRAGEAEVPEPAGAAGSVSSPSEDGCVESATTLCLQEGRYEVTVDFTANGETMPAKVARPRTDDSGLFYFFAPNNWEMLLKVLDGCGVNQHHWVFAASATDVGLNLTVRDTMSAASKTYIKDPGEPAPAITDVGAFPDACAATS
ncbi:MAG: hypothetical protein F4210_15590 [Holophagales bacterium]|nr:hypothetical protein [Holophagales bacterium]MYF96894.1 hypothetical protein [Holophagales bacterium]